MDIEEFLEIVEQCKGFERPEEALEEILAELNPEEIAEFSAFD
ncbi:MULTISPECIES: hypothetical protein [Burkholderia]